MESRRPRKRTSLLSFCIIASCHIDLSPTEAFGTLRPIARTLLFHEGRHSCALEAVRSKKTNNKSNNKSASSKEKKSSSTKSSPNKSSRQPPSSAPTRRARAPPWQVLSSKDAQKNIQNEVERRQLVQEGVIPSHQEPATTQTKDKKQQSQLSKSFLSPAQQQFCNWKRVSPFTTPLRLRFISSHLESHTLPASLGIPEIAFLGRSNVGKSSLLNRLSSLSASDSSGGGGGGASREMSSTVARVGQTPGATASVNFYALTQTQKSRDWLSFVDLPGYGYAKLSRDRQAAIQQVAEDYLQKRGPELSLGILLVDARRIPTTDDCSVLAALYDMGLPILVVATKRDKLKPNELQIQLERIRKELGLPDGQPLCVSSVTGEGCKDLWKIILEASEGSVKEFRSKYEGGEAIDLTADNELVGDKDDGIHDDEWYDDEELVYSQGYDWVHGNDMVMYEGEADYNDGDDGEDDEAFDEADEEDDTPIVQRETLKSLRKKARLMERRGEV